MNASLVVQIVVIVVCVCAAAAYTLRNFTPAVSAWLRNRIADRLERSGRTGVAARLRPPAVNDPTCGTGGGACSSCGNCGSSNDVPLKQHNPEHKLVFHQRR